MGKRYRNTKRMERARNLPEEILVAKGQVDINSERFDQQLILDKINDKMDIESAKIKNR